MKPKILAAALAVILAGPFAYAARKPKERMTTPVYEDTTNFTEVFAVNVGSYNSVKIYTPRQTVVPIEERVVMIQNTDPNRYVHITTWLVPMTNILTSTSNVEASWLLAPSTQGIVSQLILNANTTYYARYDYGGPAVASGIIRGAVHSVSEPLLQR